MAFMDQNYREFLTQRDATLAEREEKLRSEIESLNRDLSEITVERQEIGHILSSVRINSFHQDLKPSNVARLTIKEAVLKTLRSYNRPMGALEILDKLKEDFGMVYERTSLSPQLSRLKAEEKISLDRGAWSLKIQSPGT